MTNNPPYVMFALEELRKYAVSIDDQELLKHHRNLHVSYFDLANRASQQTPIGMLKWCQFLWDQLDHRYEIKDGTGDSFLVDSNSARVPCVIDGFGRKRLSKGPQWLSKRGRTSDNSDANRIELHHFSACQTKPTYEGKQIWSFEVDIYEGGDTIRSLKVCADRITGLERDEKTNIDQKVLDVMTLITLKYY